jgi:putative membrane protein (TIGR04086 family)
MNLVLKGAGLAFAISIASFAVFAFLLMLTGNPEQFIEIVVLIVMLISIPVASFLVVRVQYARKKGVSWGISIGLVYVLMEYILRIILLRKLAFDFVPLLRTFFLAAVVGGAGGYLGMNFKKQKKVSEIRKSYFID